MFIGIADLASSTWLGQYRTNESHYHIADLYGPLLPPLPHPLGETCFRAGGITATFEPPDISSAVPSAPTTTEAAAGTAKVELAGIGEDTASGPPTEVGAEAYPETGGADSPAKTTPPPGATDATLEEAAAAVGLEAA